MSTALTNFAGAVGSSFTVSLDTASSTGRVTISNSFWPSYVQFTSTDARDVLGFEYDFDYPSAASVVTSFCGELGTFNAGWLWNVASGNDAGAFGGVTMTAVSTPTYSHVGARGGADKAISFDSAADAFSAADNFDVGATDDFVIVAVVKNTATAPANRTWFEKFSTSGFYSYRAGDALLRFVVTDGVDSATASCTQLLGEWAIVMMVLDRTAATVRVGLHGLRSGTQSISSTASTSAVGALSNAGSFLVGAGTAAGQGDTDMQVSALYVGAGAGAAAGMSAGMSAALTSFAAYMKAQTGTEQAEGLFLPGCPISLDGDPTQAPRVSDLRTTMSPTGAVFGLSGNVRFEHTGIVWSHVDRERVWESAAEYSNASWESFFVTTQMGMGHEWFTPASPIQIYWENAGSTVLLGADYNGGTGLSGWNIVNVASVAVPKAISTWTGLFKIELPKIVSAG
jgi:hypothetical protein